MKVLWENLISALAYIRSSGLFGQAALGQQQQQPLYSAWCAPDPLLSAQNSFFPFHYSHGPCHPLHLHPQLPAPPSQYIPNLTILSCNANPKHPNPPTPTSKPTLVSGALALQLNIQLVYIISTCQWSHFSVGQELCFPKALFHEPNHRSQCVMKADLPCESYYYVL